MSDSSSSSSSSSESENDVLDLLYSSSDSELEYFVQRERPKNENYVQETIPRYDDVEYMEHFRVSRHVTEVIAEEFAVSQYYNYQAGGNGKLNPINQVMVYLWFVGHQTASFRDVADRFSIAISTLHQIIQKMTYFLSNKSAHVITWPGNNEKHQIERHFRENNFPGVIGCIDGSHVKIDKPIDDPDSYLNRKHYFSIQMQVVCDHTRKIRDIFVGFPGSVHDSRVFRTSPLGRNLAEKCEHFFLLGDSGYPCLQHLLTPFRDRGNLTRRQRNYNLKLSSNRYIIEHCFGILKQKFRTLYHVKLRRTQDIVHLIRACCVLHNLAIDDDFPEIEEEFEAGNDVNEIAEDLGDMDDRNGIQRRNDIVNMLPL